MKKIALTSTLTALVLFAGTAQAQYFTGDTKNACEALLCLSSGNPPHECNEPLQLYYGITRKKAIDTQNARQAFLQLCPTSSSTTTSSVSVSSATPSQTQTQTQKTVISTYDPAAFPAHFDPAKAPIGIRPGIDPIYTDASPLKLPDGTLCSGWAVYCDTAAKKQTDAGIVFTPKVSGKPVVSTYDPAAFPAHFDPAKAPIGIRPGIDLIYTTSAPYIRADGKPCSGWASVCEK